MANDRVRTCTAQCARAGGCNSVPCEDRRPNPCENIRRPILIMTPDPMEGRHANYVCVGSDEDKFIIKDVGPWDVHLSITNDAEWVVQNVLQYNDLKGRRLIYIDSSGSFAELAYNEKERLFQGFLEWDKLEPPEPLDRLDQLIIEDEE